MFLSREIDIQLCQIYTKINIHIQFCIKVDQIQKICNQSENDDIPEKANCNLGLLLNLLFLFSMDFIHNINFTSVLLDQKFRQ